MTEIEFKGLQLAVTMLNRKIDDHEKDIAEIRGVINRIVGILEKCQNG